MKKKLNPNLIERKLKTGTLFLDKKDYTVYGLNESAAKILDLFKSGLDEGKIFDEIKKEYSGNEAIIKKEISKTVKQIKSLKLIK